MKRFLTTATLSLSLTFATMSLAHAAKPSAESLVKLQEVSLMNSQFKKMASMNDDLLNNVIQSELQQLKDDEITPEQLERIKEVIATYSKKINQEMFTPEIQNQLIERFIATAGEYYTQKEVDAMIDFYSSDLGKSIVEKQGVVAQAYMTDIMPTIIEHAHKVQEKYHPQMIDELSKIIKK